MDSPRLHLAQPQEFFREKLTRAVKSMQIDLNDQIEFYLVNLLCDFIDPAKLNQVAGEGAFLNTPLAIVLKNALEAPPPIQMKLLKGLGDTSLYVAGFFQDFFSTKTYDVDYYITIGSNAYTKVSWLMREHHRDEHFTAMYEDLSEQFYSLVKVLSMISDMSSSNDVFNILSTYERWHRVPSDRLRRLLEREGINPINLLKKN